MLSPQSELPSVQVRMSHVIFLAVGRSGSLDVLLTGFTFVTRHARVALENGTGMELIEVVTAYISGLSSPTAANFQSNTRLL